jgi:aspartyl aminopeptidase
MANSTLTSLFHFIDSSPTPLHAVKTTIDVLTKNGFIDQKAFNTPLAQQGFFAAEGAVVAWKLGASHAPLRIIGAHTDSPNLRVQPHPNISRAGWSQLGVEIYGGVLLNSWLDRDLGIAGQVIDAEGQSHLFLVDRPLARVAQLAIHLDREINDRGLVLDKFSHTSPIWGTKTPEFSEWLTQITGVQDIRAFDAHLFDVQKASVLGVDESLIASARLDNQLSCWAAVMALAQSETGDTTQIIVLNDHEEVGSASVGGAAAQLLTSLISVMNEQNNLTSGDAHEKLSRSWCLSADNAHAVHPNYIERHDPNHAPIPNCGPALKLNGNQRYATSAKGAAHLRSVATSAGVPLQTFVSRNNMPCGSTIGPITATQLGIEAIDIGVPQLSMHSARELCGASDPQYLLDLMQAFLVR